MPSLRRCGHRTQLRACLQLARPWGHDGKPGWHGATNGKALLYAGAGEALRDWEAVIHGPEVFARLAGEGSSQRAPEGQPDDRAVRFFLALAGRKRILSPGRQG